MIAYRLGSDELVELRFAVSPMSETVLSLRVLQSPRRYPLHRRWLASLRRTQAPPGLDVLLSLLTARGWLPDFLSPRPERPAPTFEAELEELAATDPERVRHDLLALPELGHHLAATSADDVLAATVSALSGYWRWAIEPDWPRLRSVLEADIRHRGQECTSRGIGAMLAGLSPRVRFDPPTLEVAIPGAPPRRIDGGGRGLVLVPSLFALHTAVPVDDSAPPVVIYAARGVGTLWERPAAAPATLTAVLGRSRAELLGRLAEPTSSTELAALSGTTVSAVNQHLRALRDAGLLESARVGRSVLYRRTALADTLVDDSPL